MYLYLFTEDATQPNRYGFEEYLRCAATATATALHCTHCLLIPTTDAATALYLEPDGRTRSLERPVPLPPDGNESGVNVGQ